MDLLLTKETLKEYLDNAFPRADFKYTLTTSDGKEHVLDGDDLDLDLDNELDLDLDDELVLDPIDDDLDPDEEDGAHSANIVAEATTELLFGLSYAPVKILIGVNDSNMLVIEMRFSKLEENLTNLKLLNAYNNSSVFSCACIDEEGIFSVRAHSMISCNDDIPFIADILISLITDEPTLEDIVDVLG